jgi:hypothetical protein
MVQALDHERWYVGAQDLSSGEAIVRAFDLPGRNVASHGWVAQHGNMSRDNAAR